MSVNSGYCNRVFNPQTFKQPNTMLFLQVCVVLLVTPALSYFPALTVSEVLLSFLEPVFDAVRVWLAARLPARLLEVLLDERELLPVFFSLLDAREISLEGALHIGEARFSD